ncbi:unnamed protein product [Dimorphilus gyrociliatus]|uniref:Uncharacterized protein n=1 Tax=Dimorphilus gyrociliatus TaxID=2664684 RepID=A0A7I8W4X6_9ANNE|nr:unnamed protein product [Dimorphilus gyrociliatus]
MKQLLWIILCVIFIARTTVICGLLPFQNTNLSWDERANDIVKRLTLEEIQSHLTEGGGSGHSRLPPIPRLGIKPFTFDTECLHGVNNNATGFPQSIGLAATFNPKLLYEIGNVIGREARAGYNKYSSKGQYGVDQGMVCLTPVINIMRHPLWGRNQETYGEDPFMSGVLADRIVSGLQGPKEYKYMQAATGCKHFDAYTGPETIPSSRFSFNANISDTDLHMTFLPAFKKCVDAGAAALMCSYNAINGIPACANRRLLTDILRKQWNFKGYVISDMGAISHIYDSHHYTSTLIDAVAEAMNAGTNFNMPGGKSPYSLLIEAVGRGLIKESTVREAIKPLFLTRLKLGEFDPPEYNIYNTYKFDDIIHNRAHTNTALLAAVQSFVLLKNNREALPIRSKPRKVALIGPFVDDANQQFGSYAAHVEPKYTTTPWTGLKNLGKLVTKAEGCFDIGCHKYDSLTIASAVNDADYIIACMGLGSWEGEGNDRANLELPGNQTRLIMDAAKTSLFHSNRE